MSEKVNIKTRTKKLHKKYGKVAMIEMIERDPFVPEFLEDELEESLPKARCITPTDLSRKHGISVSAAKRLLERFEEKNLVELVHSTSRLRMYKGAKK